MDIVRTKEITESKRQSFDLWWLEPDRSAISRAGDSYSSRPKATEFYLHISRVVQNQKSDWSGESPRVSCMPKRAGTSGHSLT